MRAQQLAMYTAIADFQVRKSFEHEQKDGTKLSRHHQDLRSPF
jgi:hypothetical protein